MKDIIRMNQLAGIITEGQAKKMLEVLNEDASFPYQIDDERGRELYTKYNKASENPAWKNIDGNYELEIDLKTLLKITGMTLDELKELSDNYGDESWSIYVDKNKSTVTQTND
jgi:hypothetical protein